jgi:hypothetical protein
MTCQSRALTRRACSSCACTLASHSTSVPKLTPPPQAKSAARGARGGGGGGGDANEPWDELLAIGISQKMDLSSAGATGSCTHCRQHQLRELEPPAGVVFANPKISPPARRGGKRAVVGAGKDQDHALEELTHNLAAVTLPRYTQAVDNDDRRPARGGDGAGRRIPILSRCAFCCTLTRMH